MKRRFESEGLQVEVRLEDFLDHEPSVPYDGIVILGVIEHIPHYRRFAQRAWSCLRPGGVIYLDASANTLKYDIPRFLRRYIWTGVTSFMVLQDVIRELLFNGFQILSVRNEADDYRRTIEHWAQRFDNERKQIVEKWGESTYRTFRLYFWASVHALAYDRAQAYRLIARRREVEGPRPGVLRRFAHFVRDPTP
jgi:cyclopropane-fatty-acyl-phospholipid synthase